MPNGLLPTTSMSATLSVSSIFRSASSFWLNWSGNYCLLWYMLNEWMICNCIGIWQCSLTTTNSTMCCKWTSSSMGRATRLLRLRLTTPAPTPSPWKGPEPSTSSAASQATVKRVRRWRSRSPEPHPLRYLPSLPAQAQAQAHSQMGLPPLQARPQLAVPTTCPCWCCCCCCLPLLSHFTISLFEFECLGWAVSLTSICYSKYRTSVVALALRCYNLLLCTMHDILFMNMMDMPLSCLYFCPLLTNYANLMLYFPTSKL